jgi:DNA-binding CsgD family transcriptional regulator
VEVSLDEVSAVIRLVREVCDLWDDPRAWREHLLKEACRLLNGNAGMIMADYGHTKGWFGKLTVLSVVGLPESFRSQIQSFVSQADQRHYDDVSETHSPNISGISTVIAKQGWFTMASNQFQNREAYHASPIYLNLRKPMDCDDYVLSIRHVDVPSRPEALQIDRPHDSPPFGAREVMLLKLLHDEIAPLVGIRLTTEEHISRDGLSKRLRETLTLLLAGYSEKQAANELKLGVRTVHDYVTMLYQHFQVSSRAELLAYFIRRMPMPRRPAIAAPDLIG